MEENHTQILWKQKANIKLLSEDKKWFLKANIKRQEIFWKQKANIKWLSEGDKTTNHCLLHMYTKARAT